MLSFDVNSSFTNVPINSDIRCLEERLPEFHYSNTEITELLSLTILCVGHTAFDFSGSTYIQTECFGYE